MAKNKENIFSRFIKEELSPIITGFLKKVLDSEVRSVQKSFRRTVD